MKTKEINICKRYIKASKIFNCKYKGKYEIFVYLDLNYLHINLYDLINNKYYPFKILHDELHYISINNIVNAFEELISSIDESGIMIIKWR